MAQNLLNELYVADPVFAAQVMEKLTAEDVSSLSPHLKDFVDDTVWALSMETVFARTVAFGFIDLVRAGCPHQIPRYHRYVKKFGKEGPAKGKVMAESLVSVLTQNDAGIFEQFLTTVDTMLEKGTYTLYGPFKALAVMCTAGDRKSIHAYLNLLADTFSISLTYRQCRPLTYTLPKAALDFSSRKRAFQIRQLSRVIRADFGLVDFFLEGMKKGLNLLTENALDNFVSAGLSGLSKNKRKCSRFLSMDSSLGQSTFEDLQVAVPISQVRYAIGHYINARTGKHVPVKGMPDDKIAADGENPFSYSDGTSIWLPGEISRFDDKRKNVDLYKNLAKLEAGFFEFNTFDFDLEKLVLRLDGVNADNLKPDSSCSDLVVFLNSFDDSSMAVDLFTVFEHGRITDLTAARYPGLIRRVLPEFRAEASRIGNDGPVQVLYRVVALGMEAGIKGEWERIIRKTTALYRKKMAQDPVVETSAELVFLSYPEIKKQVSLSLSGNDGGLVPPYNRKIDPALYFSSLFAMDKKAMMIKEMLLEKGARVYRSDVRKRLQDTNGAISPADIKELTLRHSRGDAGKSRDSVIQIDLSHAELSVIIADAGVDAAPPADVSGPAFFYKEWDSGLGDYLHHHTRVAHGLLPETNSDFYRKTLDRHHGLVKRIRYAFELLKPEGLTILRQWVEGDEFDYRALLDFAMDRKAGIMPSDRLYIKRIKQQRDVAVLLLVDLSRSTSNTVVDSEESVLDVAKEAIVLFCEALEVVGDRYAVAGFSGTGRLGVDYFRIKDFDETLDGRIRNRINAMAPQRSTRMGAAIRHATSRIEDVAAGVKLLIIIGDGFPNDVDYKKDYALEDTRKAIAEARAKNIHAHGLTVNIAGDPKLDDLYGNVHHNVISDVRELPDKLPRIYSTLTRH
jgi:nitric oxide reductase NorD protein